MPITITGHEVLGKMIKTYGRRKARKIFHASINKKKPGSKDWHKKDD